MKRSSITVVMAAALLLGLVAGSLLLVAQPRGHHAVAGPGPTATATLTSMPTATPTLTPTFAKPAGDVNCDGQVNSVDWFMMVQLIKGDIASLPCQDNGDVDGDGDIDGDDLALVCPTCPSPTPIKVSLTADSASGTLNGFFGSVQVPSPTFKPTTVNVEFSSELPSDDYAVLLSGDCLEIVTQTATGFSFEACVGGRVDWLVLVDVKPHADGDAHAHYACRQRVTGELRDTGVDVGQPKPRCPEGFRLVQIMIGH